MRRMRVFSIILGVLLILAGIYSILSPVKTSTIIPYFIGILLFMYGIGKAVRWSDERRMYGQSCWSLAGAIATVLFGIILVISPVLRLSMGAAVVVIIGCWIFVMGILRVIHAFRLRKLSRYTDIYGYPVKNNWYLACIPGILMTIFGLVNVCNPMVGLGMIGTLAGIIMIVSGSSLLSYGQMAVFW
jgi:uncharacterized membrane protein HdeD (DUF308 family)